MCLATRPYLLSNVFKGVLVGRNEKPTHTANSEFEAGSAVTLQTEVKG